MKATILQTNFTAGEFSPQVYGRVDIGKYQNGAKRLRDVIVKIFGGAKRRDGSLFVHETKTSAKRSRLIPFIYNSTTAYILEFGDLYMRVYKDGALLGAPYEIATPFTEAMLSDIDFTQGSDTMFLFHESVYPQRLVRNGDTSWTIGNAPFIETPFEEPGTYPAAALTPSGSTTVVGGAVTLTAGSAVFSAGNVGSFVKVNSGIVKITAYSSTTVVTGVAKQVLASTTAAPQDAWSLHAPAWSVSRGYPRTGTLFEQRLIAAGSPTFPQTVWGSVTGAYLDFTQGTQDDDAFAFNISSDQVNPIQYVASARVLVVLTSGGEFTITGGIEKPLAPTNVQVRQRSNYGCKRVRPLRIRDIEMFVQRVGRKVRAFGYSVQKDDFTAPDISALSEHLTESGVVDMAWQQEPNSVIYMARADGGLITVTYDADEGVTAWTFHEGFTGIVESLASIPSSDGDQMWAVVRRTIDGSSVRYVERFVEDLRADCAVMASGAPATVWGGFDHLEGEDVDVVGDGGYVGRFTVTGGNVTLPKARSTIMGGLPYRSEIELLAPEVQIGGSSAGAQMRANSIRVRVHETTGGSINDQPMIFRKSGTPTTVDAPPVEFSGYTEVSELGWDAGEAPVVISQDLPMPFYVLAAARVLTVNPG